jgi:anti-sigma regulatory factor (Ser/Thr protein kinase)
MRSYFTSIYAARPESAETIRLAVGDLLGPAMPPDELGDLMLGVGEAVANAIAHGRGPIQVHVELTERQATVRVRDCGDGFDPELLHSTGHMPELDAESGRGLHVIRQVSDSLGTYLGRGCTVSITKSLGPSRVFEPKRPD